ncbi:MAG: hypothetical protein PHP03_01400 [Candidatus Pacebacteria bacterium]|nr:hypothetical protein [Candidatus Paceibacterota bacterium]
MKRMAMFVLMFAVMVFSGNAAQAVMFKAGISFTNTASPTAGWYDAYNNNGLGANAQALFGEKLRYGFETGYFNLWSLQVESRDGQGNFLGNLTYAVTAISTMGILDYRLGEKKSAYVQGGIGVFSCSATGGTPVSHFALSLGAGYVFNKSGKVPIDAGLKYYVLNYSELGNITVLNLGVSALFAL